MIRISSSFLITLAAFSTYLCTYAFRKPFTAATYDDLALGGVDYKTLLVIAQVAGYALSKFVGIQVISSLPERKRVATLIGLILAAELALVLFGLVPPPWGVACLFLNGFPLAMVWGIVFSFVEGRRKTELIGAGLCASFVVASGVVRSVGSWLMVDGGVPELWMPAAAGGLFLVPFAISVWALARVPASSPEDVAERSPRRPMTTSERRDLLRSIPLGIVLLVAIYTTLSTFRDLRDNFAAELWNGLGYGEMPEMFALSEIPIAVIVLVAASLLVLVRSNRLAFASSIGSIVFGALIVGSGTFLFKAGAVGGAVWMIVVGLGLYIPYIAFHVAIYERLLALLGRPSNIAFLMYISDSLGYSGSVAVMTFKSFGEAEVSWLDFFVVSSYGVAVGLATAGLAAGLYFRRRFARPAVPVPAAPLRTA